MTFPNKPLTDDEWRYIVQLLSNEYDCNENPTALAALKKITGVASTGGDRTITGAVRFFAADEQVREQGVNSVIGKLMTPAGFDVEHTGGGIYLWAKSIAADDRFSMNLSGGDGDLGEKINEAFGLGVYDEDGNQVGWYESIDLHDALAHAAECEADVAAFIKKHPFN
jgi:hypothetical protein